MIKNSALSNAAQEFNASLAERWVGPYKIASRVGPHVYMVDRGQGAPIKLHTSRMKLAPAGRTATAAQAEKPKERGNVAPDGANTRAISPTNESTRTEATAGPHSPALTHREGNNPAEPALILIAPDDRPGQFQSAICEAPLPRRRGRPSRLEAARRDAQRRTAYSIPCRYFLRSRK